MPKTELGVGYTLTFTREFDAPRELVFRVWTDPAPLARWWGPSGFTNPVCEFEARPGGRIHIDMTGPDGTVYPMVGEVREIVPPQRLVLFCTCCGDDSGTPGVEVLNSVTFAEKDDGTVIEVEARVLKADPQMIDAIAGMEQGWSESLERLVETVDAIYSE
jgi:uncharacterized protein YndB with AHSA1/START domain